MSVSFLLFIQVFCYIFLLKKNIKTDCIAIGKRPSMNLKPVVSKSQTGKQTATVCFFKCLSRFSSELVWEFISACRTAAGQKCLNKTYKAFAFCLPNTQKFSKVLSQVSEMSNVRSCHGPARSIGPKGKQARRWLMCRPVFRAMPASDPHHEICLLITNRWKYRPNAFIWIEKAGLCFPIK